LEQEADTVADRVMLQEQSLASLAVPAIRIHAQPQSLQRQTGAETAGTLILIDAGPIGWAILGAIALGAVYVATRPRSTKCPPCPPNPPPEIDRVPPSAPHFPCTGDHWHYQVYNQNPTNCKCFLSSKQLGGCCGQPPMPNVPVPAPC